MTIPTPRLLLATTIPGTLRAFLLPYAEHMRARGWRVDAVTCPDPEVRPLVEPSFDRVHEVPWRRALGVADHLRAGARVRALVRREAYDVVHVHTPVAAATTRLALRHQPGTPGPAVVYTAHGLHVRGAGSAATHAAAVLAERAAGRYTDRLLVLNARDEELARRLRLVPADRIERIPVVGIDLGHYRRDAVAADAVRDVRTRLGVDGTARLLLTVAEFSPRKRHRDLVRALARLDRADVHLVMVGAGRLQDRVRADAREAGLSDRVHLVGRHADVRPWMAAADAMVLPSAREGLPRSVMEAMAMGLPVVGTDTPGTSDLLAEGCGRLVPVADPVGLAAGIRELLDHPDHTAGWVAAARDRIRGHGLDLLLDHHAAMYERLLEPEAVAA